LLLELQNALKWTNSYVSSLWTEIILRSSSSPLDRLPLSTLSINWYLIFSIKEKASPRTNHPFIMPRARNGRHSDGGRIRIDERIVDEESPIIGANIAVDQAHVVGIVQTKKASMSDKCRKEYRNRIKHIYRWLMEQYPDYFEVGTRILTQDECDDPVFLHTLMIVIWGMQE
jgi:hypothetical protein